MKMSQSRLFFLTTCLLASVALTGCPTEPDSGFRMRTPDAGIRGVICAPDGVHEVHDAFVSLFPDDDEDGEPDTLDPIASTWTDVDGSYLLPGVGGGTYVGLASKGHRSFTYPVVSAGGTQQRLERECFPGDSARVAVIPGTCDSPDTLLLDLGYRAVTLADTDLGLLTNPAQLAAWDVVIAPCGMPDTWLPQAETVSGTLTDWLEDGGSLYVSGDAWPLLEALDEELIDWMGDDEDPTAANIGFGATVPGDPLAPGLTDLVGDAAEIRFSNGWSMILEPGEGWEPLVTGSVQTIDGYFYDDSPLAVSFSGSEEGLGSEEGTIVYTSFGSENATADMKVLLSDWLSGL